MAFAYADLNHPYNQALAVTPSDSVDLPGGLTRAVFIGGSGNLTVTMNDGNNVTMAVTTAYPMIPIRCRRILSTGTTATNIVAMY